MGAGRRASRVGHRPARDPRPRRLGVGRAPADGTGSLAAFVRQRHGHHRAPGRERGARRAEEAGARARSHGGTARRLTNLARSRREIEAARLLAEGDFAAQAVSRAYYAAFYAAELALGSLEESRSKHSGVIAAFGKLVVREGGLDEPIGRILRSLFEQRNAVDYGEADPSREDAELSIRDAQRFVDAVESWLTAHG